MRKYRGYTLCNVSIYPSFPVYSILNPQGKEVDSTLFPSEFKEIVRKHIKAHSVEPINRERV